MLDVTSIIKKNDETFYDFRTNARISTRPRLILIASISVPLALLICGDLEGFFTSVITVQAILIGFTFSVMFFLVEGQKSQETPQTSESREDKIKRKRLGKLSKEIFHNISYFNLVAMASLALAVALMTPNAAGIFSSLTFLPAPLRGQISSAYEVVRITVSFAMRSLFFFLVLESAYTFARSVGRVNYLFGERIANQANEA